MKLLRFRILTMQLQYHVATHQRELSYHCNVSTHTKQHNITSQTPHCFMIRLPTVNVGTHTVWTPSSWAATGVAIGIAGILVSIISSRSPNPWPCGYTHAGKRHNFRDL